MTYVFLFYFTLFVNIDNNFRQFFSQMFLILITFIKNSSVGVTKNM